MTTTTARHCWRSTSTPSCPGEDYSWLPEARFDSRAWLEYVLPDLQAELEQPDTGSGFDYEPAPFIHVEHRETVENALRELGHEVVDFPRLVEFYYEPPKNWRDKLPSATDTRTT